MAVSILSSASEPSPGKLFPLGPEGMAFVGQAHMGPPGPLWAWPSWAGPLGSPLDPYGPGPHRPGPYGPPWALMGRALMGRALMGPLGPSPDFT